MADQLPRAGTGQEIYIFRTVHAPPSAASEQYGLEPDLPEPYALNRTKARLGIAGRMRESSGDKLPITVQIEGIATLQGSLDRLVERALSSDTVRITDLVSRVKRAHLPPSVGLPVPRFSVRFGNDSQPRGINTAFAAVDGFANLTAPAGYIVITTASVAPAASLCVDRSGAVLCAYLIEKSGAPNAGEDKIACARFDPTTDSGWVSLVDETGMDFMGALIQPQIALVLYRGDVFAIVTNAAGFGFAGTIQVHRLDAASGAFIKVSGPTPIGTSNGLLANGGLTAVAMADRVVVAVGAYSSPAIVFRETTRTVWIGQSSDLSTWSEAAGGESGFVALDAFRQVLPPEADGTLANEQVNKIHFASDKLTGWAVTQGGRIYGTLDAGLTWSRQNSPVAVSLYDIAVVNGSGISTLLAACGASGCILRSIDSGVNWKIVSMSASDGATIDGDRFITSEGGRRSRPDVGDQAFYALTFNADATGWFVGENKILYHANFASASGDGFVKQSQPPETTATYTSVVLLDATTKTILLGGIIQRNRTKAPKDLGRYRFLRLANAHDSQDSDFTFHDELTADDGRIEAIVRRAEGLDQPTNRAYAVGRGGVMRYSVNLDAPTPTWTAIPIPTKRDLVGLVWREGTTDAGQEFLVVTADGVLVRSVCTGADWIIQHIATETVGRAIAVPQPVSFDAGGQLQPDEGIVLCGGSRGLWYTDLGASFEALPSLTALRGGELLLATADLGSGRMRLRRSVDRGLTFSQIDLNGQAVVTFPKEDDIQFIDDTTLRPCLFVDEAGQLLLTAGDSGVVCQDGRGDKWLDADDRRLTLALGAYPIAEASMQNRSRQTIAFGAGRYLSVTLRTAGGGAVESRLAREWEPGASLPFNPIIPGVQQWAGVDNLRIIFDDTEAPIGEVWFINPSYRAPARNLTLDTRSLGWRGNVGSTADVMIDWDRLVFLFLLPSLGRGDAWNITASALFGTNFRNAELHLSNEPGTAFPADPADFIVLPMSADLETFSVASNPGTDTPHAILGAVGAAWVPSRFRPGVRQYYVEVNRGGTRKVYKIADNTADALVVERDNTASAIQVGDLATIFTDRMVTIGQGGMVAGVAQTDVMGSKYEFVRWVRLFIPNQPTAEGYLKIDSALLGRHVAVTIQRPEGLEPRDRFDVGWRWRPTIAVIEERAAAGALAVAHLNRPIQAWSLAYSAVQWFDRDATIGPILTAMRDAFALIFDDAVPLSVELVRLGSNLPDVVHSGADLHGYNIDLEECM